VAYAIVSKIITALFGEYKCISDKALAPLDAKRREVMELLLTGGECFIKPCPTPVGFDFTLVPRQNILVFGRDGQGRPNDIGMVEQSYRGKYYYTLLERRRAENGYLTIENKLYRASNRENLGNPVSLREHPLYAELPAKYVIEAPIGLGMVQMKTPILNCVDGSYDGVAIYAPAVGLIANIDQNEQQLCGEFSRGESRVFASSDLLDGELGLKDHLFVGLNESPENVGINIFSPKLREGSYLARKQEYLRNVESMVGLRRGMLSDAQEDKRTATEITSSAGDFNLTVISYQQIWEQAVRETALLCRLLAELYGLPLPSVKVQFDWGNGMLFDEDKTWEDYRQMVRDGILAPEVALGWRFGLPWETEADRKAIREKYMVR
jgi:A118 family predicted phage portal protein